MIMACKSVLIGMYHDGAVPTYRIWNFLSVGDGGRFGYPKFASNVFKSDVDVTLMRRSYLLKKVSFNAKGLIR